MLAKKRFTPSIRQKAGFKNKSLLHRKKNYPALSAAIALSE
jgi:hypothetical protein